MVEEAKKIIGEMLDCTDRLSELMKGGDQFLALETVTTKLNELEIAIHTMRKTFEQALDNDKGEPE